MGVGENGRLKGIMENGIEIVICIRWLFAVESVLFTEKGRICLTRRMFFTVIMLGFLAVYSYQGNSALAFGPSEAQVNDESFKVDYSDPGFQGTQFEMNEAAYREFKRADDKLNEIYGQILVRYKNNQVFLDKLVEAELAWIKFRDAHLEAIYPEENKRLYYGSIYPMVYSLENAKLTWNRVKELNEWLIDYPDGMVGLGSRGWAQRHSQ